MVFNGIILKSPRASRDPNFLAHFEKGGCFGEAEAGDFKTIVNSL